MYQDYLGKDKFFEEFAKKGFTQEEIEKAYSRLEKLFKVCLLQEAFDRLEKGEQTILSQGVDFKKPEEGEKFLVRVNEYLTGNPTKINKEEVIPAAIKSTFASFKELSELFKTE